MVRRFGWKAFRTYSKVLHVIKIYHSKTCIKTYWPHKINWCSDIQRIRSKYTYHRQRLKLYYLTSSMDNSTSWEVAGFGLTNGFSTLLVNRLFISVFTKAHVNPISDDSIQHNTALILEHKYSYFPLMYIQLFRLPAMLRNSSFSHVFISPLYRVLFMTGTSIFS